jgi:hypothetical protein
VARSCRRALFSSDNVIPHELGAGQEAFSWYRRDHSLGAAAVASFLAAVLTEIYLCNVCSYQEILRSNKRG